MRLRALPLLVIRCIVALGVLGLIGGQTDFTTNPKAALAALCVGLLICLGTWGITRLIRRF